ncbi:Vps16, C-terminal region [Carpediemonas membranifera]|uniref:Vps16, C-terminal region n=1 Tax=Carpediemonas membranifera TaxID=201153 RepID=A0A8J6E3H9_9EUKA|nr:Vps16, C-terminal region [Carpediemonas membranifera]|eukprot:KAG9395636.1 Vps16, C-terminal region [Carpediemonas membranifera]
MQNASWRDLQPGEESSLYYQCVELYNGLNWAGSYRRDTLASYDLTVGRCGGLVAMQKKRGIMAAAVGSTKPHIKIRAQNGDEFGHSSSIFLDPAHRVAGTHWTDDDRLIVVYDNGQYAVHDGFTCEELLAQDFSEKIQSNIYRITHVAFQGNGFIAAVEPKVAEQKVNNTVVRHRLKIVYIDDIDTAVEYTELINVPSINVPVTCLTLIPSDLNPVSESCGFLSTDEQLYIISPTGMEAAPSNLSFPDIEFMCASQEKDGRSALAIVTKREDDELQAALRVLIADQSTSTILSMVAVEFNTGVNPAHALARSDLTGVFWCSDLAIAFHYSLDAPLDDVCDRVVLVGVRGHTIDFEFNETTRVSMEPDGLRVIGENALYMITQVPAPVVNVFRVGSGKPSASLYTAAKEYHKNRTDAQSLHSSTLDAVVVTLKPSLTEAISDCAQSAKYTFKPKLQKKLLRGANFGRGFDPSICRDEVVAIARTLRVLNAVTNRNDSCMPLTFHQFDALGADALVARLIRRQKHFVAFTVCKLLHRPLDPVVTDWAIHKVREGHAENVPEVELVDPIVKKMSLCPNNRYRPVVEEASTLTLRTLARALIDFEPDIRERCDLLMDQGFWTEALDVALERDSDIVYHVVLCAKRHFVPRTKENEMTSMEQARFNEGLEQLFNIINVPGARHLFLNYCRMHNLDLSYHFSKLIKSPGLVAESIIAGAYGQADIDGRISYLEGAAKYSNSVGDGQFTASTKQEIQLLKLRQKLSGDLEMRFMPGDPGPSQRTGSVFDTVYTLVRNGKDKEANTVRKEMKMDERLWYHANLQAMSAEERWGDLFKFFNSGRSPIGVRPFYKACVDANRITDALMYVPRIGDPVERVKALITCGDYSKVSEECANLRPETIRDQILPHVSDPVAVRTLHAVINKLVELKAGRK